MPSKTKKQSKTQSKLSHSGQSLSPFTPPSSTACPDSAVSEEDLLYSLKEASSKYPSLIGTSAFIAQVTDIAPESKGCKIWLSESSMVASSLAPGSIVSVSLVSSRKDFLNGHPLSSLADECAGNNGIGSDDIMANHVGHYFALATIFSSCKVLKNGVRLSSNLSYTMGSPALGSIVFVYSVQNQPLACSENGDDKLRGAAGNCLSLYKCKELYLELAHSSNGGMQPIINFSEEPSNDSLGAQISSSPRTPLRDSKVRSHSTDQLTSSRCEKSVSSLSNSRTSFEPFDVRDVLGDESTKKLLQTCATSWLNSRILLYGNFVTMPILSQLCIFRVIGANTLLTNNGDCNLTGKDGDSLFGQALKSADHVDNAFVVDSNTKVYLSFPSNVALESPQGRNLPRLNLVCKEFQDNMETNIIRLGGLSEEYATLKSIVSSSLKINLSRSGLLPTKGVLLHGPPGTGKTSLARLCAHDAGINIFSVNGPEIVSQYYGESEKALHRVFDSASQAAPSVVFIDELDAIAPARKDGSEELSPSLVAALLILMDGIRRTDGVLVIAATNRPDSIEPALRRCGRFDREIEIGVPSPKQRLEILLILLSRMDHTLSNAQAQQLAMATHGFVGVDLESLCNKAALVCLKRYALSKLTCCNLPSIISSTLSGDSADGIEGVCDCSKDIGCMLLRNHSESVSSSNSDLPISSEALPYFSSMGSVLECPHNIQDVSDNSIKKTCVVEDDMLKVAFEDFEKARTKVRPSAMREITLEVPKVNWDDVGGQKEVKVQLIEAVEWSQKYQDAFKSIGTRPPAGVLMFGPPGCSKTLLARAVASEAGLNFLAVKGPELFSKWVGESEKAVRSLFAKARHNAPSIIFFDEIDSLAVTRGKENDGVSVGDRVMSQLLTELDGLRQRVNVIVIAATNRPDKIDPALLRPGRFDRMLYVGPPNESDREDIFRIHLRKIPCSTDVSIKDLASLTEGCTGADISFICREAAIAALEESLDTSEITMEHLKTAIRQVQPTETQSYEELSSQFERFVCSRSDTDASKYKPCSSWISFCAIESVIQGSCELEPH